MADAIVVAAGRSSRMGGQDKLLAPIGGRPLLAWTLAALAGSPRVERIVVVAAPEQVEAFRTASWLPSAVAAVVAGGTRRQESVAVGFATLTALGTGRNADAGADPADDDRVVLVHDGARPVLTARLIEHVIEATARHGAAIPVVPVAETLKRVEVDRRRRDRRPLRPRRRADAPGRPPGLLRAAYAQYPPDGPETGPMRPPCWRPVESPSMSFPVTRAISR